MCSNNDIHKCLVVDAEEDSEEVDEVEDVADIVVGRMKDLRL